MHIKFHTQTICSSPKLHSVATNTAHLFPSSLHPLFILAGSPPAGRCTLRWQPKCQLALHMPASAVPAYCCCSSAGFSWPDPPQICSLSLTSTPRTSTPSPSLSKACTLTPLTQSCVPVFLFHKQVKPFWQSAHIPLFYPLVCIILTCICPFFYTLCWFSATLIYSSPHSSFLRPSLTRCWETGAG